MKVSLDSAELAVNMLLPGSITVNKADLQLDQQHEQLLNKLISIRQASVPIFMNGKGT